MFYVSLLRKLSSIRLEVNLILFNIFDGSAFEDLSKTWAQLFLGDILFFFSYEYHSRKWRLEFLNPDTTSNGELNKGGKTRKHGNLKQLTICMATTMPQRYTNINITEINWIIKDITCKASKIFCFLMFTSKDSKCVSKKSGECLRRSLRYFEASARGSSVWKV